MKLIKHLIFIPILGIIIFLFVYALDCIRVNRIHKKMHKKVMEDE